MHVLDDESIQSLIYRTHVLNGINDFSNIIDIKGLWISFPRIKIGTLDLYTKLGEKSVLSMLQRQGVAPYKGHRFDDPAPYRSSLALFYRKNTEVRRFNKYTIKFCNQCIQDSLFKHGFGYLKFEWIKSGFCQKHDTALQIIPQQSRVESLRCLNMVFRGELPLECKEFASSKNMNSFAQSNRSHKKLHFASCLQDDFSFFIKEERHSIGEDIDEMLRFSLSKGVISDSYFSQPYVTKYIFNALKDSKSAALKKFLEKYAELKIMQTGVLSSSSIFEKVLKSNREDCALCKHTSCVSNRAITRPKKVNLLLICELVQNAISRGLMKKHSVSADEAKKAIADMSIEKKRELRRNHIGWSYKLYK